MKTTNGHLAFLLLLVGSGCALAQDAKPGEPRSIAQVLERSVAGVESDFVPAAEAMPEDKYSYAPSSGEFKGVRTFAQQARHVAAVNYLAGAAILEEKPPVELGGENGPDSVKTKPEIVAASPQCRRSATTGKPYQPPATFAWSDMGSNEFWF